jgi:hypothetical protein
MEWKEWKSIEEENPRRNYGLLLKINPKKEDPCFPVQGNYYYGFFWECGYVYITGVISPDGSVSGMAWKATKQYDLDEIFWFTSIGTDK